MLELEQQELTIGDVKYVLLQAPFFEAKRKAEKMTALLRGVIDVKVQGKQDFGLDIKIPEILANITSPEFQEIQDFILKNIQVIKDGEAVKMETQNDIANHFNKHRSHYYNVILEGAKFHFLDFLPFGKELLTNIVEQAKKKMQSQATQTGSSTPQS